MISKCQSKLPGATRQFCFAAWLEFLVLCDRFGSEVTEGTDADEGGGDDEG